MEPGDSGAYVHILDAAASWFRELSALSFPHPKSDMNDNLVQRLS